MTIRILQIFAWSLALFLPYIAMAQETRTQIKSDLVGLGMPSELSAKVAEISTGLAIFSSNVKISKTPFVVSANTVDGADNAIISISGGSTDAGTTGAYLSLAGNENGAGQPGEAIIHAGNVTNARILLRTSGTQNIEHMLNSVVSFIEKPGTGGASFIGHTGPLDADVTTVSGGTPRFAAVGDPDSGSQYVAVSTGADASGSLMYSFKTRATTDEATTALISGDELWKIRGHGSDGAGAYRRSASIDMFAGGTFSGTSSPGYIEFKTTPSGSINLATNLTIETDGDALFAQRVTSSRATDLGWTPVNAANQACNTTCTNACVFGMNTGALGNFVDCADATADTCICAGAS